MCAQSLLCSTCHESRRSKHSRIHEYASNKRARVRIETQFDFGILQNSKFILIFLFSPICPPIASLEEERSSPSVGSGNGTGSNGSSSEKEPLSTKQRHQMKHRELFLSRQVETLPATHIRGKCSVTLLNETESMLSYLNKDVSSMKISNPMECDENFSKKFSLIYLHCLFSSFVTFLKVN